MPRRFTILALVVLLASFTAPRAFASPKPPPPTCADLIGTNLYSCTGTVEGQSSTPPFCIEGSGATGGEQFDVSFGGAPLVCNCNPTGSGKKLKFRSSPHAFMCTSPDLGAITGKVTAKGAKIKNGIGIGGGDEVPSLIFSCQLDPTCVNPF